MDIKIIISADEKALEFSRNLGKFFQAYVSQSDIEAGVCGKFQEGITATLEPDTMPWEDEVEKGRMYAETAQKTASEAAQKAIEKHNQEAKSAAPAPAVEAVQPTTSKPVPTQADEPIPTLADLKKLAAQIGTKSGRDKFLDLKNDMGVESLQALDEKGRKEFGTYMQDYLDGKQPQA